MRSIRLCGGYAHLNVPRIKVKPTAAARTLAKARREYLVLSLLKQLEANHLASLFLREHPFHPTRKWQLDLYAPAYKLGVEIHGGVHKIEFRGQDRGRHVRGDGFARDREKMNAAVELRLRVLEYPTAAIHDGTAAAQIARCLARDLHTTDLFRRTSDGFTD